MITTTKPHPGSTAEEVSLGLDLSGQTILVTGCNSGLGFETMRVLALRGARVFALGRNLSIASAACDRICGEVVPVGCDLSDLASVRRAIAQINVPIDVIVANAGVMALAELSKLNGVEAQMFTNHVGHFELITRLLEQLTRRGRVVVVSSAAHSFARGKGVVFDTLEWNRPYKPWVAYGQSKLANILFSRQLALRLTNGQVVNALHPGVIQTLLYRHLTDQDKNRMTANLKMRTPEEGAALQVYLAVHPDTGTATGQYFSGFEERVPSALARDDGLAERLWSTTESLVASI